MALHNYLWLIWIAIFHLLVSTSSSSLTVDSQVQGCSLVGIDFQHCLAPSSEKTPLSLDSCCTVLNQALEAGYYCLCSLLGPSGYPVFSTELALSFSNCYISVPPLTHCHVSEPHPVMVAPPIVALPLLNLPTPPAPPLPPSSPLLPVLTPPDFPRGEGFVPLPPKVNEMPLTDNSSIVEGNPILNSSPMPMLSIPERWDYLTSDGGNAKMLLNSRILLMIVSFCMYWVRNLS
ncbi:hypothetical protein DH2020_019922 [Rehmannia glutinosa]|uniref:Bifunctional inhibitor/plant lipid transfer protein/seed storage helical domain-containing protein n=1 Tax=Rehmannia glutinosa TaxID=99300 RepID=A0ABR0WEW3_REHGL